MNKHVYQLESVDLENRTGILNIRSEYPINSKVTTINVEISRYLAGAIRSNTNKHLKEGDTFIGTKFTSINQDMSYENNPFKLKHFKPVGGSDIPEHFLLELVNEQDPIKKDKVHLDGTKYIEYTQRYLRPKFYKRYIICINTLMMKDLPKAINIVSPI